MSSSSFSESSRSSSEAKQDEGSNYQAFQEEPETTTSHQESFLDAFNAINGITTPPQVPVVTMQPNIPMPNITGSIEDLPLHMYDPRCFLPLDARLQHYLHGLLPIDPETRKLGMVFLNQLCVLEGTHWTHFVEYQAPDQFDYDDGFEMFFVDEPVHVEADLLVTNLVSIFDEVAIVDGFDDPNFFDCEGDMIKCFESPDAYDDEAVVNVLLQRNFNVVRFSPHSFGFYTVGGSIPNNFTAVREMSEHGFIPTSLQSYLIGYSIKCGKEISYSLFTCGPGKGSSQELADVAPSRGVHDIFSGCLTPSWEDYPEDEDDDYSFDLTPVQGNLTGFQKFKEDSKGISVPGKKERCFLESDDLNGLFQDEEIALAVNAQMNSSVISNMTGRVRRYLERVGWFFLAGSDRYVLLYKLLQVSGAFNVLKRKFKDKKSFIIAMKIWLFRTPLVSQPHDLRIVFISV